MRNSSIGYFIFTHGKKDGEIYGEMMKEGVPFNLRELKVKGDELIAAGIPKEKCGKVLDRLLLECAVLPQLNEKNKLIITAKRILRDNN